MVRVTRRAALGLTAGALSTLAACGRGVKDASRTALNLPQSPVPVSFDHGVASGDAEAAHVILWTRITPPEGHTGPISVRCLISTEGAAVTDAPLDRKIPDNATGRIYVVETSAERDWTVKIDAGADAPGTLAPGEVYTYQFSVLTGDGLVHSPVGTTRTLPETGGDSFSFAVVSCSNYPFGYFNVYRAIANRKDVDAVLHLGDYIYEYGIDGYGGSVGAGLGRNHNPITEIVTLDDYRMRHAQYKSDEDLQAAHAAAPWFCIWDDHESTNNAYRTGAENHQPEENEGDWTTRKQMAVQAYLEWMPVRDPEAGKAREAIYRSMNIGSLASINLLEGRLTGRSDEISWFAELGGVSPLEVPMKAGLTMARVSEASRTMLGEVQEQWLTDRLKASVDAGHTWQLLGNQVILANVRPPRFRDLLTEDQINGLENSYAKALVDFSQLGLPWNLDAWDGFPAARTRLFDTIRATNSQMVAFTGDTHTAWANQLHDASGEIIGAEFGCTAVTSPGFGTYMPIDNLGEMFADANRDVVWYKPFEKGFTLVNVTPEAVTATFHSVPTVTERTDETRVDAVFETRATEDRRPGPVTRIS